MLITMVFQGSRRRGEPHRRRGAAMAGQRRKHDRGLAVRVEIGPVHRHFDAGAWPNHIGNPVAARGIDADPLVGQQPVHRFDGMLGDQTARQRQTLSDRVDRQGRGSDDTESGIGQGQYPFGVRVALDQVLQETVHPWEAKGLVRFH
jgi:hypothetical protein